MPLHLAIWACLLAIFSPKHFLSFQERQTKLLGITAASDNCSALVIRRAFWLSLLLVILSGIFGGASGLLAGQVFGPASPRLISTLQVIGACILLWGTLFVRGWEIQTYKGHTLIEMVNQWLYRTLYCIGTAVLVASLIWPTS
ncbi:MAG: hypothetical protein CTY33_09230 [Methylotenera sp.]|nr:MAG: hypothetical protein CTY33_09230 [Methylotenera sp.]